MISNLRIRDIDNHYHCSIIGSCLTLEEVRSILAISYDEDFSECSDYLLHGIAVKSVSEFSRFSNRITGRLNSKYKTDVFQASKLNSYIQLEKFWKESFESGNIAGPYWATLSHPECSITLRNMVFGEVHMLSHLAGASERSKRIELNENEKSIANLGFQISNLKERLLESTERNKILQKDNRRLCTELSISKKETYEENIGNPDLYKKVENYKRKLCVYTKRNEMLQQKVFELLEALNLEKEQKEIIQNVATEQNSSLCEKGVSTFTTSLDGKKVLLVGGRLSMVPHCRAVVEAMNGRFYYHDGGKEQSRVVLKKLSSSADIVICALDCVSHDASRCVKRMCSKQQQVIMMKKSGLSTFARELKKAV